MKPWFAGQELHFSCTRCGACCRRPGYVFLRPAEAERIARRLRGSEANASDLVGELWERLENGDLYMEVREGGACPLLGSQGCRVHDIKPLQCATYPFWDDILESAQSWKAEAHWCEGIGPTGRPYGELDIVALLRERSRTAEAAEATIADDGPAEATKAEAGSAEG